MTTRSDPSSRASTLWGTAPVEFMRFSKDQREYTTRTCEGGMPGPNGTTRPLTVTGLSCQDARLIQMDRVARLAPFTHEEKQKGIPFGSVPIYSLDGKLVRHFKDLEKVGPMQACGFGDLTQGKGFIYDDPSRVGANKSLCTNYIEFWNTVASYAPKSS